jgi:dipeptidyl aminopeptidase/acylaminoacyl peptidase
VVYDVEFRSGPDGSYVYVPKGRERSPGVVVLHGSEGGWSGWSSWLALALAMHGFVTVAPNYAKGGNGWHAGDIHDVDLEGTVEALDRLRGHEAVGGGRVGLFGVSRGAEHALLLVSLMARDGVPGLPDAVAAHSPSDTIAPPFISANYHPTERRAADPSKRAWRWRGSSDDLKPTTPIEVERYAGPLFLSHGEADPVWTVECTRRLEARMTAAGRSPEVHYYAGELHNFRAETRNLQHARLVAFFRRHLEGSGGDATS